MSSEPSQTPDSSTASEKVARNPMERIIVWGLIIGLLVIVGFEAMARFSYQNSLNSISAELKKDEDGDPLTIDEVSAHIFGFPAESHDADNRVLTYTWRGLIKKYGSIELPYSHENEVTHLVTAGAPDETEESDFIEEEADDPELAGADGDSGGGGRRGRRFDPMQFDADSDGKVSREEAPGRLQENFDEIDTNGDGFADAAELEARAASRRRSRGGNGNNENRPQRPQRPESRDSSDDAPAGESPEESAEAAATPETDEDSPEE